MTDGEDPQEAKLCVSWINTDKNLPGHLSIYSPIIEYDATSTSYVLVDDGPVLFQPKTRSFHWHLNKWITWFYKYNLHLGSSKHWPLKWVSIIFPWGSLWLDSYIVGIWYSNVCSSKILTIFVPSRKFLLDHISCVWNATSCVCSSTCSLKKILKLKKHVIHIIIHLENLLGIIKLR